MSLYLNIMLVVSVGGVQSLAEGCTAEGFFHQHAPVGGPVIPQPSGARPSDPTPDTHTERARERWRE